MYVKLDSQSLINVYKSLEKYFNKLLQLFEKQKNFYQISDFQKWLIIGHL